MLSRATTIRAIARPRVHVGLIDLGDASPRAYCGVGFSVGGISTTWSVSRAAQTRLIQTERLDTDARNDLEEITRQLSLRSLGLPFEAELESAPQQHIGLGSKTTLCLCLIAAVNELNQLSLSQNEMQHISGRAGASGVGANLFFSGGVVWDGGHARRALATYAPSSAQRPAAIPPLLSRWLFPQKWRIALLLPLGVKANGAYEKAFFAQHTPLPKSEILETMCVMYHGVVPGFALEDIGTLGDALQELHKFGFKKKELDGQSPATRSTLELLHTSREICSGMSSMGPLLYSIFDAGNKGAEKFIRQACIARDADFLGVFEGWNTAHEVRCE